MNITSKLSAVSTQAREVCQIRIAKQLAVSQGQIWDKLNPKAQALHLTVANNIIATVERSMVDWEW